MSERWVGRFTVNDADGGLGRRVGAADEARKTKVASFNGRHYSAEVGSDGMLHVYAHHDELGMPAQEYGAEGIYNGSDAVPAPSSLQDLNAMARAHYPIGIRPTRTR